MAKRERNTKLPRSKAKTAYGLLSEIRALILAEPKRYDQKNTLVVRDKDIPSGDYFPSCGTVGCVAGWVTKLKSRRPMHEQNVLRFAARVLGIDYEKQGDELFNGYAADGESQTVEHAESGAAHIARFQKKYRAQLLAKSVQS